MHMFKMALRNLRRNLRRTIITTIAIAFGLALLIVSSGMGDGAHGQMIESGVSSMAGHVVVQGAGWQKKRETGIVVPNSNAIVARLQHALPDAAIVKRVYLQGLLTSPTASVGVRISAVDVDTEKTVNDLHTKLTKGSYLDATTNSIVLGKTLAETLAVDVGDKVVLMVQHAGEIESRLFRVQGLFRVGIDEIDGFYAQIPLSAAQEVLGLHDDVTQISVHVQSYRDSQQALHKVQQTLQGANIEILAWQQALPELYQWVTLDDAGLYFMIVIIAVIVALGIVNTVLMSVLERVREFGVMLALGMTPRRLWTLIMLEASLLAFFAVIGGVALGLLGNWPLTVYGIDMTGVSSMDAMEAAGVPMSLHWYNDLSASKTCIFALLAYAMTMAAAIYPAFKAAALRPIESLQHR